MSESKLINDVIKKFGIHPKDVFLHESKKYKIIKRSGYLQIAAVLKMEISLELEAYDAANKAAAVKAIDQVSKTHTFGEASPDNNTFPYPLNVAQKRAEGRLILQVAELYEQGFITEDEIDFRLEEQAVLEKVKKAQDVGKASIDSTKAKLGISAAKN